MPSPRVDKDIRLLMDKLYHIREPHIKAILLFGSRARGEAQDRSDVDLLILHDGCGIDDPVARRRYLYGHDPSGRVCELVGKFPGAAKEIAEELAAIVREIAPEHGRSSYGEPGVGSTPSDTYKEKHAVNALTNTRRAKEITERILNRLGVGL